jgi:tetratricopeptide (TPR) repeat protein
LNGKEKERQRLYVTAGDEYKKALEKEPWFVPALTAMANLAYRKTDYQTAFDYSLKALSIDTYDPEANMAYGLAGLALGDTISAIDGFSIAASAISQRSAAYNALASVFMNKGDYAEALNYAEKSLVVNQLGSDAIQLKILALRKLDRLKDAGIELDKLETKDPLNHFIRFENYLTNPASENKAFVQKNITNELPHETYLEYAVWYSRNGQIADALKILELAPDNHPVVLLWNSYLNHLAGNDQKASTVMASALQLSPQLIFPFRIETLKPLEWAQSLSDNWKLNYYTGLIYQNAGNEEKAKNLWNSCGDKPDFYPFYIARSQMPGAESRQIQADVEKALSIAGNDWRTGLFAVKYYFEKGNTVKAEELARDFYKQNPENYYLGLQFAKVLEMNKKYSECVSLLQNIRVLPNEGATEGRTIWRNANLGLSLDFLKVKNFKKALGSIEKARQWPFNLGVGRPYKVDERIEDFIAMECYKKQKNKLSAEETQNRITSESAQKDELYNANDFLTAWLLKEAGNKPEGDLLINKMLAQNPSSKSIEWCNAVYSGNLEHARIIEKDADQNDRTFQIIRRINDELINAK